MFVDPRLKRLWTQAGTPLDRQELDNRNSGDPDAFGLLANAFNDYSRYSYRNPAILYGTDRRPVSPFQAAPGMEALAAQCWEIDPNSSDRPTRDGAWVKREWGKMRSILTAIRQNYLKSGNQDTSDKYGEWMKFASKHGDVYCLMIAIIPLGTIDELGHALPDDAQRDTGGTIDDTFLTNVTCSYHMLFPYLPH